MRSPTELRVRPDSAGRFLPPLLLPDRSPCVDLARRGRGPCRNESTEFFLMRRFPDRTERRRTPLVLLVVVIAAGPAVAAGPGPKVDFNRDIRPILADKCF